METKCCGAGHHADAKWLRTVEVAIEARIQKGEQTQNTTTPTQNTINKNEK